MALEIAALVPVALATPSNHCLGGSRPRLSHVLFELVVEGVISHNAPYLSKMASDHSILNSTPTPAPVLPTSPWRVELQEVSAGAADAVVAGCCQDARAA